MKKRIYKIHFSDSQYAAEKPDEDYCLYSQNIFAVFDGVTLLHQKPYPNPSPAYQAAILGAKTILEFFKKHPAKNKIALKKAFLKANAKIRRYNDSLGITKNTVDYLQKQYAAAVGTFGFLTNNVLYFAYINDCGVAIINKTTQKIKNFTTDKTSCYQYLEKLRQTGKFKAGGKEEHVFVRSRLVNNVGARFKEHKLDFGVMTGEKEAGNFLKIHSQKIRPNQTIMFYTDGFLPFLKDEKFLSLLRQSADINSLKMCINRKSQQEEFGREKTAIIVET